MASLTKMMTFLVTLQTAKRLALNVYSTRIRVSLEASEMKGTHSGLQCGDTLTIEDLLYCMMLPSGNDAALALAESIGMLLYKSSNKLLSLAGKLIIHPTQSSWLFLTGACVHQSESHGMSSSAILLLCVASQTSAVRRCSTSCFVSEMNRLAEQLNLTNTRFANPHGLDDGNNHYSSAKDMARLACMLFKEDPLVTQVVSTVMHECHVETSEQQTKQLHVENLNKLLLIDGFIGVKTGHTKKAGACLVSCYKKYLPEYSHHANLIVVVMESSTKHARFDDTLAIIQMYKDEL